MISGGKGGANTKSGLHFEDRVDFLEVLKQIEGYEVDGRDIKYKGEIVALSLRKHELYRFLDEKKVDHQRMLSKKLLPDDAIYVPATDTFYVIEIKFQNTPGSVDEKLQTCHFKKRQYERLLSDLGVEVEYIYILNDWFKSPSYDDVLTYIKEVGCDYYFSEIDLDRLGLPS